MLEIRKDNALYIDGNKVLLTGSELTKLLIGCLDAEITIEKGVSVGDVMHVLYNIKDFVNDYFAEEYESVRSVVTVGNLLSPAESITIRKGIEIDEKNVLYVNTSIDINHKSNSFTKLGDVEILFDDIIVNVDNVLTKDVRTKIYFIDLIKAIFEDLLYLIKNTPLLQ